MQGISMSFCFVCLLHLANERGLKIEVMESLGVEDKGQSEEGDNNVGDLWGLRVIFVLSSCSSYRMGNDCRFYIGLPISKRRSLSVMDKPSGQRTWSIHSDASTSFLSFCSFLYLTDCSIFPLAFGSPPTYCISYQPL